MKTKTIKEIQSWIKEIEEDIKNNWSRWGDVSNFTRDDTVKKLKRIRVALNEKLQDEN